MKLFHHSRSSHAKASVWKEALHSIGRDPFMDWSIIVAVFALVAAAFVWGGVSAYMNVDQIAGSAPLQSGHAATVNTQALSKVLGRFDERASTRASLMRGYSGPADPSL